MPDKSPDAFRTISEVADDMDVPQHVLRFWETRFVQIKPLKRGGGRRYYRPDDVDLLRGLKRLLYGEGYTIKGVQRILKERGARHVIAIGRGAPVEPEPREVTAGSGDMQPVSRHALPQQTGLAPVGLTPGTALALEAAQSPPASAAQARGTPGLRLALSELAQARARLADVAGTTRTDGEAA